LTALRSAIKLTSMTGGQRDNDDPPVITKTFLMYEVFLHFRKHIFLTGQGRAFPA